MSRALTRDGALQKRGFLSPPRHHMAPPQGACGRGCAPVPNPIWGRGLSERSACPEQREGTLNQKPSCSGKADSSLSLGMTTERHRMGPRPGAHGFGSFCRNKRTASCGAEPPQNLSPSVILALPLLSSSTLVIEDPASFLCLCLSPSVILDACPRPDRGSSQGRDPVSFSMYPACSLRMNRKRDSETGRAGPGPAREFHAPLEIHARSRVKNEPPPTVHHSFTPSG